MSTFQPPASADERHSGADSSAEEATGTAERDLRLVLDNVPALVKTMTPSGAIDFANRRLLDYLGVGLDQLQDWPQFIHESDRSMMLEQVRQSLERGQAYEAQCRLRRADGVYRWVQGSAVPARGQDGSVVRWYYLITDIDDRRRAEDLLRSSERKLRAIVNNIPASIAIHSAAGELEFENRFAEKYHGRGADDQQQSPDSTVHPDDLPALVVAQQRALATGEPLEFELRLRRADGAYRWYHMRSRRSTDDDDGASRWYTVGTDIHDRKVAEEALQRSETERSLAEESLRESERHSRLIVDSIPGLFGLLTADGDFQFLNRQILDYTGMTLEELKQRGTRDTIHPEDRPHVMQVFTRAIVAGRPYEMVWRFRRSDGVYRWFQNNGFPVRDTSGNIVGWCVLMTDIDERRRAEDALHHMQARLSRATQVAAVGEMAGSIAHEVNQPLAAVVANGHACLRWLSASPPNVGKAIEAAERIVKDGKDAGEVVRRVRALLKRTVLERIPLDLREVIAEVVRLLDNHPARRHVSLDVELDPAVSPVLADRVQVQQLVLNLMLNALEALEPVSGRVKQLSIRATCAGADAVIEVSDNGIGLDDPVTVFEPFVTTKAEGMGLGLAICRSIVTAHGGSLSAERNAGFGMKFRVTLPLQPAEVPS